MSINNYKPINDYKLIYNHESKYQIQTGIYYAEKDNILEKIKKTGLYSIDFLNQTIKDDFLNNTLKNAENIDYYLGKNNNISDNKINNDIIKLLNNSNSVIESSFVISKLNKNNKYSSNYQNCTGIVAIGKSKENGENLSLLTHQCPQYFLANEINKKNFTSELETIFEELKEKCIKGTIDAIILGGNSNKKFEEYEKSIDYLNEIIYNNFKIIPGVIGGPSINGEDLEGKDIIVNTIERKIILLKGYNDIRSNVNFTKDNIFSIINYLKKIKK